MALDADRLIKNEVRILKALRRKWIREAKMGITSLPTIHHTSIKHYVEAVYAAHRATIEAWGDWRFHGPTITVPEKVTAVSALPAFQAAKTWAVSKAIAEGISGVKATADAGGFIVELRYYSKANATLQQAREAPFDYTSRLQSDMMAVLSQKNLEEYKQYLGTTKAMLLVLTLHTGEAWTIPIRPLQRVASVMLEMLTHEPIAREGRSVNKTSLTASVRVLTWVLTRFYELIGEQWASQTVPVAATLSVAPSSFLRLGEIGEHNTKTGNSSCYGNAKTYEPAKTYLSLMPSTYVAFFYRDKIAEQFRVSKRGRRIGKIAGRCYGILDPETGMAATNFYMLSKEMATPALHAAAKALGMSFGLDKEVSNIASQYFNGYGGHPNGDYVPIAARRPFAEIIKLAYDLFANGYVRVGRWTDPCCDTMSRDVLLKQYQLVHEVRSRIVDKSTKPKSVHIGEEFKQEVWMPGAYEPPWRDEEDRL